MVTDNDITYAESQVRRLEESLAVKKREGTEDEVKKIEAELALKIRDAQDLKSRKRHNDDQERRDKEQKERDDRRHRFA